MHFKYSFIYIFGIFNILFYSCDFTDNTSFNPAYLDLSNPSLVTLPGQGDATIKVEEVYVYVDGNLLGVFPLPTKVPVIVSGSESKIRIAAAIKINGTQSTSSEYPFYEPIESNLKLEEGKTYSIPLVYHYTTTAKFDFAEGFESGNIFNTDLDEDTNTNLSTSTLDAASGNKAGIYRNSGQRPLTEVTHGAILPRSENAGGRVFLEMDYKSQDPIALGTIQYNSSSSAKVYKITLKPSDEWNKVYIDFTDEISANNIIGYKFCMYSFYDGNDNNIERNTFVDNVKLIHF